MKRPALIWLTFLLLLSLALGAMGWMTRTVLRLEDAQARATAAAQLEEGVRLALWRMDGALAPILSPEIARPYFEYSPVFPAERAYTRMYTELKLGDVLVPSPLLRPASPYILLNFQIDPDGKVSSPQAPAGDVRRITQARYSTAADIEQAERRVAEVARIVKTPTLLAQVPPPRDAQSWQGGKIRVASNGSLSNGFTLNARDNESPRQSYGNIAAGNSNIYANNAPPQFDFVQQAQVQQLKGQLEYNARKQTQDDNNDILLSNGANPSVTPGVSLGVMTPVWVDDTLLLARQVSVNGKTYVQGCLLDWPAIRKWLLESAADLLPEATLIPVRAGASDDAQPRRLASIPARLELAPIPPPAASPFSFSNLSPTGVTLIVAWLGVLLACGAVAVLLRGVIALSQRRAGFVSAVTHELRTPLTTLRMYTEMLADNMVPDEAKRSAYLKTMRAEANRLGHLVDNVLLYSRLERSNRDSRVEVAPLGDLLDRLLPRLIDRVQQAGMTLVTTIAPDAQAARVRANLLSVEQILFNLVDNACKYASTTDGKIELSADLPEPGRLRIRVADHGPGLDATARARLFQPFSKSVHEAADSAPGLGLGLALSHRLAKNMSADLRLDPTPSGAAFVLTLPLA